VNQPRTGGGRQKTKYETVKNTKAIEKANGADGFRARPSPEKDGRNNRFDFHDRSLSRGQKLSRRASEERGCEFFLISSPRVLASRPWFLDRTRLPFAGAAFLLPRRLSLCFPASLETYQREHWKLALLRPVGLTARSGRLRAEEILLVRRHVSTQRCCYSSLLFENSVCPRSTVMR